MEVDEKPTDTYADIGGLDKQIEELVEAMYVSCHISPAISGMLTFG